MMERNILAMIALVPLVVGITNAAEIYNKDDNKADPYGEVIGLHHFSKDNGENSHGGNGDTAYARLGFKGETQINSDLTGYGQWEYSFQGNNSEGADTQAGDKMRLTLASLKYVDTDSFDYGCNYGMIYDTLGYTDMLPESGGDTAYSDDFFVGRVGGVTTYCNSNFFSLVGGLNFTVQYLDKNERNTVRRPNGDGVDGSISYEHEGFGVVGAYSAADRINLQEGSSLDKGRKVEQWTVGLEYDANNIYLVANYGGTYNATPITNKFTNTSSFANKTQDVLLAAQYQFDSGLCPSAVYTKSKTKDVEGVSDTDLVDYFEVGAAYYFNKNASTYVDYIINQIDSDNKLGAGSDGIVTVGIVYQL